MSPGFNGFGPWLLGDFASDWHGKTRHCGGTCGGVRWLIHGTKKVEKGRQDGSRNRQRFQRHSPMTCFPPGMCPLCKLIHQQHYQWAHPLMGLISSWSNQYCHHLRSKAFSHDPLYRYFIAKPHSELQQSTQNVVIAITLYRETITPDSV